MYLKSPLDPLNSAPYWPDLQTERPVLRALGHLSGEPSPGWDLPLIKASRVSPGIFQTETGQQGALKRC